MFVRCIARTVVIRRVWYGVNVYEMFEPCSKYYETCRALLHGYGLGSTHRLWVLEYDGYVGSRSQRDIGFILRITMLLLLESYSCKCSSSMLELATREAVSLSRCTHALFPRYGSKRESCSRRRVGCGEAGILASRYLAFGVFLLGYTHVHDRHRVIPKHM
jgi:hypothetical protein